MTIVTPLAIYVPIQHYTSASALGEDFGIPNRSLDPLARRAGRDHPFPAYAGSPWRARDIARRVRHGWPATPGKTTTHELRVSNPTRPRLPSRAWCAEGPLGALAPWSLTLSSLSSRARVGPPPLVFEGRVPNGLSLAFFWGCLLLQCVTHCTNVQCICVVQM